MHTDKDIWDKSMELKKLTYEINGAIFEVNRIILGAGFLEKSV